MRKFTLLIAGLLMVITSFAQDSINKLSASQIASMPPRSTWSTSPITIGGYVDAYYSFNFNTPVNDQNSYLYNYNRHNEYTTNLTLITADYNYNNVRAKLGLMAGTYAEANLAAEPNALQHIYQASVGYKLGAKTWIDAGIFPSHLGFESVQNTENYTLTRSFANENSPYYLAGVKLNHKINEKIDFTLILCNGWQNMRERPENSNKAAGIKVKYKAGEKLTINYANFLGNEMPDTARQNRFFNNFYADWKPTGRWDVLLGLDYGIQDNLNGEAASTWMVPTLIGRYKMKDKWFITSRVEYYDDPDEVIVTNEAIGGYSVLGTSLGFDYKPQDNVRFGIEGRYMDGRPDYTFVARDGIRYTQTMITTVMAIRF